MREFLAAGIRSQDMPFGYFRLRHPKISTLSVWRARSRWYHSLRPVEECYFIERHGVVLWGEDLRHDCAPPVNRAVVRSAAAAVADLRNRIWSALHHDQPPRLADLIVGRIPALWLLLAHMGIATSTEEAVMACSSNGFPHWEDLRALRRRLAGLPFTSLPSTRDPVWSACLQSLSDWLDGLATMALHALDSAR